MAELLSDDALVAALTELEGWSLVSDGKAIEAEFAILTHQRPNDKTVKTI